MPNVLESYLVSLGFSVEEPSWRKFTGVMQDAEKSVQTHTTGMARYILEAQGAIVGSFTAISGAIIGLVDKVAMSDQAFRLQGLAMMMSGESMRKLDFITKSLGASLQELVWDPELHSRAMIMSHDFDSMLAALGPERFEHAMLGIRNIRSEFSRLQMAGQFLAMNFTTSLWEKFFPNDGAVKKFSDWIDKLDVEIPAIASKLADYAVPALHMTWDVLKGVGEVAEEGAVAFSNIIGLLSGDTSIEGAAFSFDHLAGAIEHVGHWLVRFESWIVNAEKMLAEFASGTSLLLSGQFSGAAAEYSKMLSNLGGGSGAIAGMALGAPVGAGAGALYGAVEGGVAGAALGPVGMVGGAIAGAGVGAAGGGIGATILGGTAGYTAGKFREWLGIGEAPEQPARSGWVNKLESWLSPSPARPAAQPEPGNASAATSRDELVSKIADAIANVEAGNKPNPISVRQNNPGNLRSWGDTPSENGYARFATWDDGMTALRQQIQKNIDRGLTLEEFFGGKKGVYPGFSPASDNNQPDRYAATVAQRVGVDVNIPLNKLIAPAAPTPSYERPAAPAPATPAPSFFDKYFRQPQTPDDSAAPTPMFSAPPSSDDAEPAAPITPLAQYMNPAITSPLAQYNVAPEATQKFLSAPQAVQSFLNRPPAPDVTTNNISRDQNVDVHQIVVNIQQPGATADQVKKAVTDGVRDGLRSETVFDLTQLQPTW
jgi:hypothetical protein